MIRPMKYQRIDIQSKVFDGVKPNRKHDCSYCVELLGTLKYDRIDIQSKVFDSANCIPTLYRLFNNCDNITRYGSIARLGITKAKQKR